MSRIRLLHTACLVVLVSSLIVSLLAGCSRGISGPVIIGNVAASPKPTPSHETPETVQQTPESILNDGALGKTETVLDITVTIPWVYFYEDFNPEAYTEKNGFISTTVHENGNVSFTMSKARYEELLSQMAADVEHCFNKFLIDGIDTPYIKVITSTDGYQKVAVDVDRVSYKKDITGLKCYEVWSCVQLYQYYLGVPPQCEVNIYDAQTGDLIETIAYPISSTASAVGTATPTIEEATPAQDGLDFITGNNFLIAVQKADIDFDGKVDAVQLYCACDPSGDFTRFALKIGDTKICIDQYGYELYLGLADIDKNDKFVEIAVIFVECSDYTQTSFFRYDGKSIIKLGTIEGFCGEHRSGAYSFAGDVPVDGVDGSGIVRTRTRGWILHTWFYDDEYIITNSTLKQVPKDLYLMNYEVTVIKEITLKKSRTDASPGITLKVGEKVTIMETDNKRWCSVVNSKGEIGWFEIYDYDTIKGTELSAGEFFDGLDYAG